MLTRPTLQIGIIRALYKLKVDLPILAGNKEIVEDRAQGFHFDESVPGGQTGSPASLAGSRSDKRLAPQRSISEKDPILLFGAVIDRQFTLGEDSGCLRVKASCACGTRPHWPGHPGHEHLSYHYSSPVGRRMRVSVASRGVTPSKRTR